VTYTFEFQGAVVTASNALHKTGRTSALRVGMPVTILADTANPRRAIILDLYV